jgi:hypothetical protein
VLYSLAGANNRKYMMVYGPLLEYAAPVWSPHLVKDIQALEAVQRWASRLALKQRRGEMSYEDRCKILKWNTLEKRREFLSLVECYKTVFGLNGISFEEVFEYKQYRATRTNHAYILFILNDQESIALNILFW